MMWFLPRSDPGAATEYLRPNGCGVSTENGTQLPYGSLPRLLMLWMYAECERTGQGTLDLGSIAEKGEKTPQVQKSWIVDFRRLLEGGNAACENSPANNTLL